MLAYMNEESLQVDLENVKLGIGPVPVKNCGHKGETSGHYQHVKKITADCDLDDKALIEKPNDWPSLVILVLSLVSLMTF